MQGKDSSVLIDIDATIAPPLDPLEGSRGLIIRANDKVLPPLDGARIAASL